MTSPAIFALIVAITLLSIVVPLIWHVRRLLNQLDLAKKEYFDLQNKFSKNPSYECQQLLASLLAGHALFHIETIDPENVFLRRR